jgi:Ca-activated chloride channel family protein
MLPLVLALAIAATGGVDRKAAKLVREGNRAYGDGQFDAAAQLYDEAQTRAPESPEVAYNMGNALCRQGRFGEAAPHLRRAAESPDPMLRERSLYNLGNALYGGRDLQGAARAYRRALALEPGDRDAKINLEKVLRELQNQPQQPQSQQGGKQDQKQPDDKQGQSNAQNQQGSNQQDDRNSQGDQEEQNPRRQDEQGQQDRDQQSRDEASQDPPGQEQDRPENAPLDPQDREQQAQAAGLDSVAAGDLSREEALRILQAMREQEKELQRERARLVRARSRRVDKDW